MGNQRKIYEDAHGTLPVGFEVHHKIPRHAGGTDDIENLEALTVEEHKAAHLHLYLLNGDFRDLAAYHMICYNFSEAHKVTSSAGGKKGGSIVKETSVGIFRSDEDRKKWASLGGSASQATLRDRKVSAFYDPVLKQQISSKGGLASRSFKDKALQSARGKKGGIKNVGTIWITDGIKSFKFRPTSDLSIDDYLLQNTNLRRGRTMKKD